MLSGLLYALARWAAAPALLQLSTAVETGLNLVATALLLPEYLSTRLLRRTTGRPPTFAYTYGDAVCGLTCAAHRVAATLLSALHTGALRINHRAAVVIGVGTAAAIVGFWW
ncbi:hypothetical protein ABZW03_10590 [Kitasatospora sp. NPDC004799]|uniref:hypothetical protein n=1 Tax=Kitasatospora sp. NPDC004799 TaxID=3154460 RepID=UPI0033B26D7D